MQTLQEKFNSIYLKILSLPAKSSMRGMISTIPKTLFAQVGQILDVESMRVYLFEFANNTVIERNICGDPECWKYVNIKSVRKDYAKKDKYHFFKIRHTTVKGKYILIGYVAIYRSQLSQGEIKCMNLFGLIYGNYISKRITLNQLEQSNNIVPRLYSMMTKGLLPGSVLLKTLSGLQRLLKFHKGLYFSIESNIIWYPEYLVTGKAEIILNTFKNVTNIKVVNSFAKLFTKNDYKPRCINAADIPMLLQKSICRKEEQLVDLFNCYFYPVILDGDLIGMWVFTYHRHQVDDFVNAEDFLRTSFPLMESTYKYLYQRRSQKMVINPIFKERDTRIKECDVFVIMPFTQDWSDSVWNYVIKPTVESLGMNAIRADDLYGQKIMEDVWKGLLQSSIVIADITGRNANVFYELGIAHTLGKKVILLTQNVDDIPFDLNVFRHIIYKTDIAGGDTLREKLKKTIIEMKAQ